jgi:SAM-dependent methyltransferase
MSRRAWNLLADEFEDTVCDITSTSGDRLAELVDRARPSRRRTLVDAGCGIGTFVKRFGPRFGRVVAFDFAEAMVRRARRRCRGLKHVQWQAMPLEEAGVRWGAIAHLAVCLNVITSPDAKLRSRQWDSLASLVRPRGFLLVVVPSLESARYVAELEGQSLPGAQEKHDLIRRTDTRQKHFSRQQLRLRVTEQGLRVLSLRRIRYPWSEEGAEHLAANSPWDWACLAQKPR